MKIQINDTNYAYFEQIFKVLATHLFKLSPPGFWKSQDAMELLKKWNPPTQSIARQGLKQGLQDLICMSKDFPPDVKIAADKELAEKNLPSLRELQGVIEKTIAKVLKRGRILSENEFYIIKEEVVDLASGISETDRSILDKYLYDFEFGAGKKRTAK